LADEENALNGFREAQHSTEDQRLPRPSDKPSVDRSSKPDPSKGPTGIPAIPSRSTKPSSSLYTSGGLRNVSVPSMLMGKFESLADPNTQSNVETCGILAGKLAQNSFKITHLLIPKQSGIHSPSFCTFSTTRVSVKYFRSHFILYQPNLRLRPLSMAEKLSKCKIIFLLILGTSDSCVTSGEEAIFEYQDSHDLITLGWVSWLFQVFRNVLQILILDCVRKQHFKI
jgi:hypothetical protein